MLSVFPTNSMITAEPIGLNLGGWKSATEMDFRIFLGCDNGMVYVVKDDLGSITVPADQEVWSRQLNGSITSIGVLESNMGPGLNIYDKFYFGTSEGDLSIFNGLFDEVDKIKVSDLEISQIIISDDGEIVHIISGDGKVTSFTTGMTNFPWSPYPNSGIFDPYMQYSTKDAAISEGIVYIPHQSGRLFAFSLENGVEVTGWEGGVELVNNDGTEMSVALTSPYVSPDGNTIMIGSESGWLYCLNGTGHIIWSYNTYGNIRATPYWDTVFSRNIFVTTNYEDGYSRLFCLRTDGNFTYSARLEGQSNIAPLVYDDHASEDEMQHIGQGEVIVVTAERIYSWRANV